MSHSQHPLLFIFRYSIATPHNPAVFLPLSFFKHFAISSLVKFFFLLLQRRLLSIPSLLSSQRFFPHSPRADIRSTVFISRIFHSPFITFLLHPSRLHALHFILFSISSHLSRTSFQTFTSVHPAFSPTFICHCYSTRTTLFPSVLSSFISVPAFVLW